ncbi:NAD(P)/FAD-dependent oxidoreductase, partial [Streptomyces asoensis]
YFWPALSGTRPPPPGFRRGPAAVAVGAGALDDRRFVAAYRTGDRVGGVLAVGMPPAAVQRWRQAVAHRAPWGEHVRVTV